MPGSKGNRNKWQPDEDFLDNSWDQMRSMLDQEMPVIAAAPESVSSGKTYLLAFAFLVSAAIGVGVILYQPNIVDSPAATQEIPQMPIALNDAVPAAPEMNQSVQKVESNSAVQKFKDNSNETQEQTNTALAFSPTVNTKRTTVQKSTSLLKSSIPSMLKASRKALLANEIENEIINLNQIDDNNTTLNNKPSNLIANTHSTAIQENSSIPVEEEKLIKKQISFESVEAIPVLAANLESERRTDPSMMLNLPRNKARVGVEAGWLYSPKFSSPGYSAGLTFEKDLNPRFALKTGLKYVHLDYAKSNRSGAYADINGDFEPGNSSISIEKLENGYIPYDFPQLDYLSVPVLLAYSINKNLKLNAGLEFSYLLDAKFKQDDPSVQGVGLEDQRLSDAIVREGLRKGNMSASVGLGYYPKSYVGLDLSYNLGLVDFTRDDYFGVQQNDAHQFLKVAFSYYFSRM